MNPYSKYSSAPGPIAMYRNNYLSGEVSSSNSEYEAAFLKEKKNYPQCKISLSELKFI